LVGILDIMPLNAMKDYSGLKSAVPRMPIAIERLRLPDDVRERPDIAALAPADQDKLDIMAGLVITGANVELNPDGSLRPFHDVEIAPQLEEVVKKALNTPNLPIWASCWASHYMVARALGYDPRSIDPNGKFVNVTADTILEPDNPMAKDMKNPLTPHGRWADVGIGELAQLENDGLEIVSVYRNGQQQGWSMATMPTEGGGTLFLAQGHPEYQAAGDRIVDEAERELAAGRPVQPFDAEHLRSLPTCVTREQTFINYGNMVLANAA
jgi:homoserine O-succinyltransferase